MPAQPTIKASTTTSKGHGFSRAKNNPAEGRTTLPKAGEKPQA
jgi:hypothetical protein